MDAETQAKLKQHHDLLLTAMQEAGPLALDYFRMETVRQWEKQDSSPVSEADLAVNELLKHRLRAMTPSFGWLSEETDDSRERLFCDWAWIIDPIDGTRAFLQGRPEFTISVALSYKQKVVAGAVLNPSTGELFEAYKGGGARLNGEPLAIQDRDELQGTRIVASHHERKKETGRLFADMEMIHISSIAYKLALTAAGRYDAMLGLMPKNEWDCAAGQIIVEEAGGVVTTGAGVDILYNQPKPRFCSIVAAGPTLHELLIERCARVGGDAGSSKGKPTDQDEA